MATNISIEIPKEHIPHMKEYYRSRLAQLQKELTEINHLLKQIEKEQSQQLSLIPDSREAPSSLNGYNPKWPIVKKAKFAIELLGRPASSSEIVDFLIENYEQDKKGERKQFMASISGTLSLKSKEGGPFKRSPNDVGEFEYTPT